MQQAVQALRQLEVHPPRNDAAPHAQPPQPQPEGLSTASQQPPVPQASAAPASFAPNPSVKRLVIRSRARELFPGFGSPKPEFPTPSSGSPNSGVGKCQNQGLANLHSRLENGGLSEAPNPIAYALLDSGATHAMRQALDEEEWEAASEVQVGDTTTTMRLTSSGTLLLPPGRDGLVQPIVPMGAIIEQLGYKLVWSAGSCKLYPPDGKSLRLRVKNG